MIVRAKIWRLAERMAQMISILCAGYLVVSILALPWYVAMSGDLIGSFFAGLAWGCGLVETLTRVGYILGMLAGLLIVMALSFGAGCLVLTILNFVL